MKKVQVEVTTPEKLAFKDEVDMLVAPATDGEIGILPGHTPLLTRLGVGEIRLKKGNDIEYLAVAGGFLEVGEHSKVSVFAETADMSHEIDLEKERLELERIKSAIKNPPPEEEFDLDLAEIQLRKSLTRLKIAQITGGKKPPPQQHL